MKRLLKNNLGFACLLFFAFAANAQDSTLKTLNLTTRYFIENNKNMYIMVSTKTRTDQGWQPVSGSAVRLYLDSESEESEIGKVTTNEKGLAKVMFPASLKPIWDSAYQHTLIGVAEATKEFEEARSETMLRKTRISLDTASGEEGKTITVSVSSLDGGEWVPAKDVEMRIGIRRLGGGILNAGEEQTYTTDSTGTVTMDVRKDTIPGDQKGNIILVAKVEDNEEYGNLEVEKTVNWGSKLEVKNDFFDQRTLWSTRNHVPGWLLLMAYGVTLSVWGTIFYLIYMIVKIKKAASQP